MKYSFTITIASLTVSIILGVFLFFPQYQDYKSAGIKLKQEKTYLTHQDKYVQQLRATGNQIKENQDIVNKLDQALPNHRDIPSFINFLEELSKSNGVSLDDIKWDSIKMAEKSQKDNNQKEDFNTYSVRISASGSYFAFRNFLFGLEKSGRLVNVKKAHFVLSKTPDELPSFDLALNIHSY